MSPASIQPVRRNLIAGRLVTFGIATFGIATFGIATFGIATFGLAPGALQGATLQRLSLDDMIIRSNHIVRGTVADSWASLTGSVIYTHYRIQVAETFKGPRQSVVEIMFPGGAVNHLQQNFSGSPVLYTGDELVFFLWTSKAGITWVTGLTQGLFALAPEVANASAADDRMATRGPSRELMLDPNTGRPVKDSALAMRLSQLRGRIAGTLAAGAQAVTRGEAQ